ncbi:MAG: hypothetical protein ACYDAE_12465 [Steroidobacteraceae bacterium]
MAGVQARKTLLHDHTPADSGASLLLSTLLCCIGSARARADTAVMVGGGATVRPWHWTDGIILPLVLITVGLH